MQLSTALYGSTSPRSTQLRTKRSKKSCDVRFLKGLCSRLQLEFSPRSCSISCQDVLAEMVHTKDGSRSVRELIVRGTAKVDQYLDGTVILLTSSAPLQDRKHIVKAIKSHVERMCKDDEAQLVLFTALDVIEYALRHPVSAHFAHAFHSDTKLTAKSLVSDVISSATSLYQSSQGRRSLIYLVAPRTRRHFTPAQVRHINYRSTW